MEDRERLLSFGPPSKCLNIHEAWPKPGVKRLQIWAVGGEAEQLEMISAEVLPNVGTGS